jgi:hypothetical protein
VTSDHDHQLRVPPNWWEVQLSSGAWFDIRAMGFARVGDNFEFTSAAAGEPNNYLLPSATVPVDIVRAIRSNDGDRRPAADRPQSIPPAEHLLAQYPRPVEMPETDSMQPGAASD